MKDVTKALRKKYFELLNNNVIINGAAVPVYYKYIPNIINTAYYIVLTTVSNTIISTKQSRITDTSLQIGIYTKDTTANAGAIADEIAEQVKDIIIPFPVNNRIDLSPDFQVVVLKPDGDQSPDALQIDDTIFINRFLTFTHKILHYPESVSA